MLVVYDSERWLVSMVHFFLRGGCGCRPTAATVKDEGRKLLVYHSIVRDVKIVRGGRPLVSWWGEVRDLPTT